MSLIPSQPVFIFIEKYFFGKDSSLYSHVDPCISHSVWLNTYCLLTEARNFAITENKSL
jgi:hypothetical protein